MKSLLVLMIQLSVSFKKITVNLNIGHVGKMSVSGFIDRRFKPGCISMLCPGARQLIGVDSVDSAVK